MAKRALLLSLVVLLTPLASHADVPGHMIFQGRLTDSLGNLLNGALTLC